MNRTGKPALCEGMMVWGDGGSFAYKEDYLDVQGSAPLVVSTNGPTTNWILIREGITAHLTLVNAQLEPSNCDSGCPAVLVERGATLHLTLKGENTLRSGWGRAGIELDGATLAITSRSTGSLLVTSDFGAAIGSGIAGCEGYGGIVFIKGGNIVALGGKDCAGIGTGATLKGQHRQPHAYSVKICGGTVRVEGGGRAAFDRAPDLNDYRASHVVGSHDEQVFEIRPLPTDIPAPLEVVDVSRVHDESIPWMVMEDGVLHAAGFNDVTAVNSANHACVDVTYELEKPGAIAYRWKVRGSDEAGEEIFDRYWFLSGSDGTFLSGSDFLGESDNYRTHLIDGLDPGTYKLTLGVFCFGTEGSVSLDLAPCA